VPKLYPVSAPLIKHSGVQARTFQVLAMTGKEKTSFFHIGIWEEALA
jgi:hypothetical protein